MTSSPPRDPRWARLLSRLHDSSEKAQQHEQLKRMRSGSPDPAIFSSVKTAAAAAATMAGTSSLGPDRSSANGGDADADASDLTPESARNRPPPLACPAEPAAAVDPIYGKPTPAAIIFNSPISNATTPSATGSSPRGASYAYSRLDGNGNGDDDDDDSSSTVSSFCNSDGIQSNNSDGSDWAASASSSPRLHTNSDTKTSGPNLPAAAAAAGGRRHQDIAAKAAARFLGVPTRILQAHKTAPPCPAGSDIPSFPSATSAAPAAAAAGVEQQQREEQERSRQRRNEADSLLRAGIARVAAGGGGDTESPPWSASAAVNERSAGSSSRRKAYRRSDVPAPRPVQPWAPWRPGMGNDEDGTDTDAGACFCVRCVH